MCSNYYNIMCDSFEEKNIKSLQRKNQKQDDGLKYDEVCGSLKEIKFDPCDPKKNFYRLIQSTALGISVRQGFKLFEVYQNQETIAKHCLCSLQAHAVFPIKIFTVECESDQICKSSNKKFIKSLWLETRIEKTPESMSEEQENRVKKFQVNIHKFFITFLIPRLESFRNNTMSQQAMFHSEDDQQTILQKFKHDILTDCNAIFADFAKGEREDQKDN